MLRRLLRVLFPPRPPPTPPPPPDPRLQADPWLARIFAVLPDRYRLGPDGPEGAQVLRRTGKARFNPMRVWVRAAERVVRGEYEVRGDPQEARALLDRRVSQRIASLGLFPAGDSVDDWGGSVLNRKYEGRCESAEQAAAAIRFLCEESEQQVNLAAE